MRKCSNCGNFVPDNAVFCDNCGQKVDFNNTGEETIFCGNCGAPLEAGAKFCGNCSAPVNDSGFSDGESAAENIAGKYLTDDTGKRKKRRSMLIPIIAVPSALAVIAAGIFGYIIFHNDDNEAVSENAAAVSQAPAASRDPEQSQAPATPEATKAVEQGKNEGDKNLVMETYYVVNCDVSISLRSEPSTSAKVLKNIPLGAPVSFASAAKDGFAKVIYDGTTGYALQSYLSKTPPANTNNQSSSGNNSSNNNNSGNNNSSAKNSGSNTSKGAVPNPSYSVYRDSDFGYSCNYPSHFQVYNDSDPFVRYSVKAPDNTAYLRICATNNSAGLSVQTVMDNFKSSYPGYVDYETSGDDWCALSTNDSSGYCNYAYFHVDGSVIRGFELHYDNSYHDIYDGYVNDIYASLKN